MKRLLIILFAALFTVAAQAQPQQRRNQQKQQKQQKTARSGMTLRAQTMFPTAVEMPENVVWRRDIYRELSLSEDANAGLYYPTEPVGKEMNLFTYIFKLALFNYIPIFEYRLDGNESFSDSSKVSIKSLLDDYHIFYEMKDGRPRVDNSDIPSAEVKTYYLKESAYYDDANSTFHRKVLALCPIMMREDDFGGEATKYPLFWVRFSDLAPYLSRQTVMTSNLNNAATMSMEDYFTLNKYNGKIYKTTNMLGRKLADYCTTDTALNKEQKRIEDEIAAFEKNIFGDQAKKDSLDSIAAASDTTKKEKKASRRSTKTTKVKSRRSSSSSSSSGGGSARVTVRRQRH